MYQDFAYIAAVALIPIIPAFILYRFLPPGQMAEVAGPFRGLDIKLTGAFAGYFLVVLIVTSFVVFLIKRQPVPQPPPAYQYEVYTVSGLVDLKGDPAAPARLDHEGFKLSLIPPERSVNPDGSFKFEIPVKRGQVGEPEFPTLIITYDEPDYPPATVHLGESSPYPQPYKVSYDRNTKRMVITPPIQFRGAPQPFRPNTEAKPYNPAEDK